MLIFHLSVGIWKKFDLTIKLLDFLTSDRLLIGFMFTWSVQIIYLISKRHLIFAADADRYNVSYAFFFIIFFFFHLAWFCDPGKNCYIVHINAARRSDRKKMIQIYNNVTYYVWARFSEMKVSCRDYFYCRRHYSRHYYFSINLYRMQSGSKKIGLLLTPRRILWYERRE